MATRNNPYGAFNFMVKLGDAGGEELIAGGFVCSWVLHDAQPKKWVGPSLTGKGGGEVAMEELHLVAESIDYQSA